VDEVKIYMVRHKATGNFYSDKYPTWVKRGGQVWKMRGHAVNRLKWLRHKGEMELLEYDLSLLQPKITSDVELQAESA
jgi:hypothetical protein